MLRKASVLFCLVLMACKSNLESLSSQNFLIEPDLPETVEDIDEKLWICSDLNFKNVYAPENFSREAINIFALALNISGSFEGHDQWQNITNNFDGQGLSLGLLNQTLETGSLQPLLIEYMQRDNEKMKSHFLHEDFLSLKQMLEQYEPGPVSFSLDSLGVKEDQSVSWALENLYSDDGRNFYPRWKNSLQQMAASKNYREIQLNAASDLHEKAMEYFDEFQLKELRSYLFLFDIVVQNGGFYRRNRDEYQIFLQENPQAQEEEKLGFLLESRLVQVRDQFREDVRSRKESLIQGSGIVHRIMRNYEQEYCYSGLQILHLESNIESSQ